MSGLRVRIAAGGETHVAELPRDVPISRLLPALLARLQLPSRAPDGSSLYGIFFLGRELGDSETLAGTGVPDEAMLELKPRFQEDPATDRPPDPVFPLLAKGIRLEPTSVSLPIVEELTRSLASVLGLHHLAIGPGNQLWVSLWDLVSVCVRPSVMLPSDIEMHRLLPALAEATGTKLHIDNIDVRYELRLRSGRVLRDEETLRQAGVEPLDTLFFLLTENRDRGDSTTGWTCWSCARPFSEEWPFCPACGAVNNAYCARCSRRIPDYFDILFCPSCGTRFPERTAR